MLMLIEAASTGPVYSTAGARQNAAAPRRCSGFVPSRAARGLERSSATRACPWPSRVAFGDGCDQSRARPPRPRHVAPAIAGLRTAADEDAVRIGDLLAGRRGEIAKHAQAAKIAAARRLARLDLDGYAQAAEVQDDVHLRPV